MTYTVEVEAGVVGVDAPGFAGFVEAVLADPRSWSAATPFTRVADPAAAQLRIVLATPPTVDALCAPLRTGGTFSCFHAGIVAINADTWLAGIPASGLDVANSRIQQLNHELGHALAHPDITSCPAPDTPAPVMLQQTLGIGDCTPNPWPFP